MKRYVDLMMLVGVIAWGVFVLALTMLPRSIPVVYRLSDALGGTNATDTFGHLALFASLTAVLWFASLHWMPSHYGLLLAMGITLMVGTGTEFYQWFMSSRSADIEDLMANWLGAFVVGFAVSYVSHVWCTMTASQSHA